MSSLSIFQKFGFSAKYAKTEKPPQVAMSSLCILQSGLFSRTVESQWSVALRSATLGSATLLASVGYWTWTGAGGVT